MWLNVVGVRGPMPADCAVTACCETVEVTTCCGEKTVEVICGKTGGECLCASEPVTPRQPSPAPIHRDSSQWVPALTLRAPEIVIESQTLAASSSQAR